MRSFEVNFDSLVGNTHHYGGLSYGNVASTQNQYQTANPKAAALQGLQKMRTLIELGIKQAILPPHDRPDLSFLRRIGFSGSNADILRSAHTHHLEYLTACYSASSMWAANAATVSPSTDTSDGKVHFSPANLVSHLHRSLETPFTYQVLKHIFSNEKYFTVHEPLPSQATFSDEGAANHTRFALNDTESGINLFVYGRSIFDNAVTSHRFPARQTLEASLSVARRHKLMPANIIFAQQNPVAIDVGVFHNDVISVGHQNVFFYHEKAFLNTPQVIRQLQDTMQEKLCLIQVGDSELSMIEAVKSYLFNSQIVSTNDGTMILIAPLESQKSGFSHNVIDRIVDYDNPIKKVVFVDCRQSMQNGGGPACLRLRVTLTEKELAHCHPGVLLDIPKCLILEDWVNRHYRDALTVEDLIDPQLITESHAALDELTKILDLGSIYPFQKEPG